MRCRVNDCGYMIETTASVLVWRTTDRVRHMTLVKLLDVTDYDEVFSG